MEDGSISSDMVTESFKRATSEGGQFFGMMDKQSQTLAGRQSTLNDSFETMMGALTEGLMPAIGMVVDCVNAVFLEENGYQTEANSFARCVKSGDYKEGTSAFLEKRKPVFRGE
jgi:enoyl-CoA hydratase